MIAKTLTGALGMAAASLVVVPACSAQTPSGGVAEETVDWRDIPLAPGTWVYRADNRGSLALYGEPNAGAHFMVRCDRAERMIYFSRAGSLDGGDGTMAFQATHGERSYQAQNGTGEQPYIVAATSAADSYLDAIAFSRGRIAVNASGQPLTAIPTWPEMTRVFEDCRG